MGWLNNIHKIASRIIPTQEIEWRKAGSSTTDQYGQRKSGYGAWTKIRAHVQPGVISSFGGKNVSEKVYDDFGLEFSHKHITVWVDGCDLTTMAKQDSPDQIKYRNCVYNIINVADWLDVDGWKRIYCEEVIP